MQTPRHNAYIHQTRIHKVMKDRSLYHSRLPLRLPSRYYIPFCPDGGEQCRPFQMLRSIQTMEKLKSKPGFFKSQFCNFLQMIEILIFLE